MTEFRDWTRGVLFLGTHNAEYIPVLVDENGNLRILMQGEYEGDLRTVALDDEGRISAFVIDSTDAWGQMLSVGNAELAARLGSPVLYHQSGRVMLMETFANGAERWVTFASGDGGMVGIDPETAMTDGYCLKLIAGSTASHNAYAYIQQALRATGRIGLSIAFSRSALFESLQLELYVADGNYETVASVLLNDVTDKVQVQTGSTTFTDIADLKLIAVGSYYFNLLKFIVDLDTARYGSVYLNQEEIDASAHQSYKTVSSVTPSIRIKIKLVGNEGQNDKVWIDNIILTVAETE